MKGICFKFIIRRFDFIIPIFHVPRISVVKSVFVVNCLNYQFEEK